MNASPSAIARPVGRPRSEKARRAVLDAAYGLLVEAGLDAFSVEAVAVRSGVARTTIHRWWPSKGLLMIESFLDAFEPQLVDTADDDDAVAAFRARLNALTRALSGAAGHVARSVVAQAQSDPETRRLFLEQFSMPLRQESARLLLLGINRGRLRADLDISVLLDAAVGAVYLRLLLGQSLEVGWSNALCDLLLRSSRIDTKVGSQTREG